MSEYNRHKFAMEWMHGGGRDPHGRGLDEEIKIGKEDWMERQRVAQGGRIGLQSGQLVQPGPGRQGYANGPPKLPNITYTSVAGTNNTIWLEHNHSTGNKSYYVDIQYRGTKLKQGRAERKRHRKGFKKLKDAKVYLEKAKKIISKEMGMPFEDVIDVGKTRLRIARNLLPQGKTNWLTSEELMEFLNKKGFDVKDNLGQRISPSKLERGSYRVGNKLIELLKPIKKGTGSHGILFWKPPTAQDLKVLKPYLLSTDIKGTDFLQEKTMKNLRELHKLPYVRQQRVKGLPLEIIHKDMLKFARQHNLTPNGLLWLMRHLSRRYKGVVLPGLEDIPVNKSYGRILSKELIKYADDIDLPKSNWLRYIFEADRLEDLGDHKGAERYRNFAKQRGFGFSGHAEHGLPIVSEKSGLTKQKDLLLRINAFLDPKVNRWKGVHFDQPLFRQGGLLQEYNRAKTNPFFENAAQKEIKQKVLQRFEWMKKHGAGKLVDMIKLNWLGNSVTASTTALPFDELTSDQQKKIDTEGKKISQQILKKEGLKKSGEIKAAFSGYKKNTNLKWKNPPISASKIFGIPLKTLGMEDLPWSKIATTAGKVLRGVGLAAAPLDVIPFAQQMERGMGIRSADTGLARLGEDILNLPHMMEDLTDMIGWTDPDTKSMEKLYEPRTFGKRYSDWVAEGRGDEKRMQSIEGMGLDQKYRDDILYSASGEADMIGELDTEKLKKEALVPLLPEKEETEEIITDESQWLAEGGTVPRTGYKTAGLATKALRVLPWLLGPIDVILEAGMALPALARGNPQMARRSTTPGVFGSYGGSMLEDIRKYNRGAYRYAKATKDINEWNALQEDIERAEKILASGEPSQGYEFLRAKQTLAEAKKQQAFLEKNFSPTKEDDFQSFQDTMTQMAEDSREWSGDKNWLGQERGEQSTQESLEAEGVKPIDAHMMMQNADTTDEWRKRAQLEELNEELAASMFSPGLDVETFLDPYGLKTQDLRYSDLPTDIASDYGSWEANQVKQKLEQLQNIDPGVAYAQGGIVGLLKK